MQAVPEVVDAEFVSGIRFPAENHAGMDAVNVMGEEFFAGEIRRRIGDDAHGKRSFLI